jgi:YHS domain-containing protein
MRFHETNAPTLTDPVCGAPVDAASPHCCVRSGAMFIFCSEACRASFAADPMRFVVVEVPKGQATESAPPRSALAEAREETLRPLQREQDASKSDRGPERRPRGGLRGLIAPRLLAWHERQHAARASREILALYRGVLADHPHLTGRDLYRKVVMARNGCDSAAADTILDCAQESFAVWPAPRELTLCDVVHYLSVAEFLAAHENEHWMHSDIEFVVSSHIPHDLCVERRSDASSDASDLRW